MITKSTPALLLGFLCITLLSCSKYVDVSDAPVTEQSMGKGVIRSITQIVNGVPQSIGVEFTPAALSGLSNNGHGMFSLAIADEFKHLTPFDHIMVDWNPKGHMPEMIYDVPHFDFHFYTINVAERLAIGTYEKDSVAFNRFPAKEFLPDVYVPAGTDPEMGRHWVDRTSEELNSARFTKTFIYGTYNGRVNFFEPMITKAYLENGASFCKPFPQPQLYSPADTYYPTEYSFTKNAAGNYYVSLEKFVFRPR